MKLYPKITRPEPNRKIRLHCHDRTPYTIEGMMVPYKPGSPKKLVGKTRFCTGFAADGKAIAYHDCWRECELWEYLDEPKAEGAA